MPALAESIGSGDSGSLSIGMSSACAASKDDGDSAALPQQPPDRLTRAQQKGPAAAQTASHIEEVQPGSRRSARAAAKQQT